jgi:hypothetical protein
MTIKAAGRAAVLLAAIVIAAGGCSFLGVSSDGVDAPAKEASATQGGVNPATKGTDDGPSPAEEQGAGAESAAADVYWANDGLIEGDADEALALLVNSTEHKRAEEDRASYLTSDSDIVVTTSHVHGSYEEDGVLKVFVTTADFYYSVREGSVKEVSGAILPKALTFRKTAGGAYATESIEPAGEGGEFGPSIKAFCKTPSGEDLPGLADKMIDYYSDYGDIMELQKTKLTNYFNSLGKKGMTLYDSSLDAASIALT